MGVWVWLIFADRLEIPLMHLADHGKFRSADYVLLSRLYLTNSFDL